MSWLLLIYSIYASYKWFVYFNAMKGLVFKLIKDHRWDPSDEELKKLQEMAIEQTIKEVFKVK